LTKHQTAILTTVFPAVEKFLPVFLTSIQQQTNQQFDLIVVNDGIDDLSILENFITKERLKILQSGQTFVENRIISILYAKQQGYQNIIFTDADDLMSENRIAVSVELLEKHPILVNDVDLMSEKGEELMSNYFSQTIIPEKEYNYSFIENKNFVGLGNTAIRTAILPEVIQLPTTLKMPDWYFFYTLMRRSNLEVFFTKQSKTYYRQHAENLIGLKEITVQRIDLGLQVKLNHYTNLITEFSDLKSILQELEQTNNYYLSGKTCQENYINKLKSINLPYPLWWEEIKTLKELNIKP